jgi:hypothetical protein
MVSPARVELATSAFAGLRAIQLRYGENLRDERGRMKDEKDTFQFSSFRLLPSSFQRAEGAGFEPAIEV